MNARSFQLSAAAAACLAAGSVATADPITFDIQSDTFDNFQFSVFHTADRNNQQSGDILVGFTGTFEVERTGFQNGVATELQFVGFDGQFVNANTGQLLGDGGSITLAESGQFSGTNTLTRGGNNDEFFAGELSLEFDFGTTGFGQSGTGAPVLNFHFLAQDFNALANRFFDGDIPDNAPGGDNSDEPRPFGLGLWGVADNSIDTDGDGFADGPGLFNSDAPEDVGIDLYATAVPLPHPGALAGLGLLGVIGVRRLRRA